MSTASRSFAWRDGHLEEIAEATSVPAAVGNLPQGAYTTLRTYSGGRVLRLDHHAKRLSKSTSVPLAPHVLRRCLAAALTAAGHHESKLRVTWAPPHLLVAVTPFEPLAQELYRDGVRCRSVDLRREDPAAKDTRFIARARAAHAALPSGTHEGLLLGPSGEILEGLTSNVFAVLDGVLRTEGDGALPGITRGLVLEVAEGVVPIDLRAVRLDDVPRLSESFLTSTSRGVLPVVEIDGHVIGSGARGLVTRELMGRFEALVAEAAVPLA